MSMYRDWIDTGDDQLTFIAHSDGEPQIRVNNQGVVLNRAQALEFYAHMGEYLAATAPLAESAATTAGEQSTVAVEAHGHVYGQRQGDYGHPREDFTRTAVLWTGLLQHKLAEGEYITPEDYARCMVAVKLSRDVHSPKRDNRIDMAGYAICLDRLETGK